MKTQIGLIGFGAGAAAALLFASVISGTWLSIILVYLSPLPIMIAGIGWSHWTALIAALTGAVTIGLVFGISHFAAFLAGVGLPACWLVYLAMLARPVAGNGGESLEWYPPGRLVIWAALLGAFEVIIAIPALGLSAEAYRAALHDTFADVLRLMTDTPADKPLVVPGIADAERMINVLVLIAGPATAVMATIANSVNLWLAGVVTRFSGQLKRPWPDLPAMSFPPLTVAALVVAIGASFMGGLVALVATVLAASLLMAFVLLGLSVVHAVTSGLKGRQFLLGAVYAALLLLGWPVLALAAIGLIDTIFNLRARIARWRQYPTLPHQP